MLDNAAAALTFNDAATARARRSKCCRSTRTCGWPACIARHRGAVHRGAIRRAVAPKGRARRRSRRARAFTSDRLEVTEQLTRGRNTGGNLPRERSRGARRRDCKPRARRWPRFSSAACCSPSCCRSRCSALWRGRSPRWPAPRGRSPIAATTRCAPSPPRKRRDRRAGRAPSIACSTRLNPRNGSAPICSSASRRPTG